MIEVTETVDESSKVESKTESAKVPEAKEGEPAPKKTKLVTVMVDIDQQDKCLAIVPRSVAAMENNSFVQVNYFAMKSYREDFLDFISRNHQSFFEDNDDYDSINKTTTE